MLRNISKPRIMLVALSIAGLLTAIAMMLSTAAGFVGHATADLSGVDFTQNKSVSLDGQWEFYWNKLLTSEDFRSGETPQMDSFMKVPGTWTGADYPRHGVATYRMVLRSSSALKDPALRIQNVASAYKFYANGQLVAEAGTLSENPADFKEGEKIVIAELPKDTQDIELIFQVGNMNYAAGGIRESPVFGSKHLLEKNDSILMAIQLLFIGSVFIFGIHYLLLFILQRADKTALLFSILCFITALRSAIWGEAPLTIFFPNMPFDVAAYINYYTGYNLIPAMLLFILSVYPLARKRSATWFVLLPTVFFDVLLLLKTPAFISAFTNYAYLFVLLQMAYMIGVMTKAVINKRDNAILMFFASHMRFCLGDQ